VVVENTLTTIQSWQKRIPRYDWYNQPGFPDEGTPSILRLSFAVDEKIGFGQIPIFNM
jgi:hypothetical protein